VDQLRSSGEDRTRLAGVVAHGHHIVEFLPGEFVQVLRTLSADVDPLLGHRGNRQRVDPRRHGSCAVNLDLPSSQVTEDAFRHLRARTVVGAEKENPDAPPPAVLGVVCRVRPVRDPRVKALCRRHYGNLL